MKILVSGTKSGLGKYIFNEIGTHRYKRNVNLNLYNKIKWDLIIHCGFYSGDDKFKNIENIYHSYVLSNLQAKRFIFISSLIVYENKTNKKENEKLNISNKNSLYCNSKILCESFYQKKNALILRLGTLIGKDMRKNNVNKVIKDKKPTLTLSKKSFYTFVDYSEVLEFINLSLRKKINGIYNFNRNDSIKLEKISKLLKKEFKYGKYHFKCILAPNKKINKIYNLDKIRSFDILRKYLS